MTMNNSIRKLKATLISGAALLCAIPAGAQTQYGPEYYGSPVGFAITMAGNVGEIRSERFHMGVDIKALQGIGSPIYAVADGYVSRVGVSPTGYGNVIYITHPNGEMSVYGHLDSFVPKIARWVRERQYARKSFRVDLYPSKDQFPVKKGERIGSLGNAGSSAGPHLHLEIRTAGSNHPRNLISQGVYKVADRVDPTVTKVLIFEVDTVQTDVGLIPVHRLRHKVPVTRQDDGTYGIGVKGDSVLPMARAGYAAYETIDFKDGKTNTMGIYSMTQSVDGQVNLDWAIDYLSYATNRYANTLISYGEHKKASRSSVLRAYLSPNNQLHIYKSNSNRGILEPPATGQSQIETVIGDEGGNRSKVRFVIRQDEKPAPEAKAGPQDKGVVWDQDFEYRDEKLRVTIPSGALYESALLPFGVCETPAGMTIGNPDIPLQKAVTAVVAAPEVPARLQNKALLVKVSVNGSGKESLSSAGGRWEEAGGGVKADLNTFGTYRVALDTVAPVIRPAFKSGGQIPSGQSLRFTVTDDLSGITGYTLTVDGAWALLSYDPKNRLMAYEPIRQAAAAKHDIVLTVTDAKGNRKTVKATYTW